MPPSGPEIPWALYLGRTSAGEVRLWRGVAADARSALAERARAALDRPGDARVAGMRREVVFRRARSLLPPPGLARRLSEADRALIDAFEPGEVDYWLQPDRGPLFGVVRDGRLLSIAHSSRRTAHACELGINTLPAARRQGFARACVLSWAPAVSAQGLHPIYSADRTNAPSLALARSCGYREAAWAVHAASPSQETTTAPSEPEPTG